LKDGTLPAYTIWVPVIAALGGAAITGTVAFGVNWLQHRRERRAAAKKELSAA